MIKKTLADKTRALYIKCGDRDDFRIFNANLEKYKYMSFYPYFDEDEDDEVLYTTPSIMIGFSDCDSTGPMSRQDAYNANMGNDDDMIFVDCALAYMLNEERVVISTSEIEPIYISPISWDTVLQAESIGEPDLGDICDPLLCYMREGSAPYEFDEYIIDFMKNQDKVKLKLIFRDGTLSDTRKTTLVYFHDEFVAALKHTGYDGCNCDVYAFDEEKWFSTLEHIKNESGVDKLFERSIVNLMDTTRNADEFLFVPGVTGVTGFQ